MQRKKTIAVVAGLIVIVAVLCTGLWYGGSFPSSDHSGNNEKNTSGSAVVSSDSAISTGEGGGEIHLSDNRVDFSGDGIFAEDKKVTISKAGIYVVDGSMTEGQLYIKVKDNDDVTLDMSGVTLSNTAERPIYVENAHELILTSTGKQPNYITAGNGTQIVQNKTVKDSVQVSAVFSKDDITIERGTFEITASGDAIHSNDDIKIKGGNLTIRCGDDGIHANNSIKIKDGVTDIKESCEGWEANRIKLSGGKHSITAKDDGINANGGSDAFDGGDRGGWNGKRKNGRPGMNGNDSSSSEKLSEKKESDATQEQTSENVEDSVDETTPELTISGGRLYVNAQGDGLDSNGNLTISGGDIVVDGPSNDGNGALDSGAENGGICKIEGGTILAVGSSGMAETFDANESTQYSLLYNFESHFDEGTEIIITDEDNKELIRHKCVRYADSIVFSSKDLEKNKTYTIKAGENTVKVKMSSRSVSSGKQSRGMGGFRGGFKRQ